MTKITKVSWTGNVAILALFLIPGFGLYLPNGLVVVLAVCALVCLLELLKTRRWPGFNKPWIWLLPILSLWSAITAFWAQDSTLAIQGMAQLSGLTLIAILLLASPIMLTAMDKDRAVKAYILGVIVAASMLTFDSLTHMRLAGWFRNYDVTDGLQLELAQRSLNRGIALLGFYMPITFFLIWRYPQPVWRWAGLLFSLIAAVLSLTWGKDAVLLSFLTAGLLAALSLLPARIGRTLVVAGFAVALLAGPLVARLIPSSPQSVWEEFRDWPPSLQHRMVIWKFTADKIAERPLIGWGMNSAKIIPGGDTDYSVGSGQGELQWRALPLHPHNAILQWWLELGAVGALLAGALVVTIIFMIWNLPDRFTRMTASACLGSAITISLLSYGAWQSWWLAGILFVAWLFKFLDPLDQA